MAKICRHCFVIGKVQGVFFRAHTQEMANNLQLTGWVENLPDGRVEVLACGEEAAVNKLIEWLKVGPPKASVTGVDVLELGYQELVKFDIN